MGAEDGERGRYIAFLSYSHRDAAQARRLHRRLERYRIPRRLVGTAGRRGPVPARLTPIFRDREELAATGDLSTTVRSALAGSDHLIILCSPNAAASLWVEREIAAFRELRPGRPILAAIVDGEPADCFPAALVAGGAEPLAADLRRAGDGRRLGFLKLVAALAGVDLDALVQRDAARRLRSVTAVTLVAFVAVLAMAVLLVLAIDARREAERRRGEAEGLVEFMLTDLRTKLKGVGRVDVLAAVNRRALDYYAHEPSLEALPADSLERRARVLHTMGEDEETRGNLAGALALFRQAEDTTATLLARAPGDPDRIFAQSQSEFWVADAHYRARRLAEARKGFLRYKALAERLVTVDPRKPAWIREAGFAEGSLCALAFEQPVDHAGALSHCGAALARVEEARRRAGTTGADDIGALISRHAWMAKAWLVNGRPERAAGDAEQQLRLAQQLVDSDPINNDYRDQWVRAQLAAAEALQASGRAEEAKERLSHAISQVSAMSRADPKNQRWKSLRDEISKNLPAME
ncbi:MAG: toll/interleukin-1 receptor domain-containing protein [Pseudomonadota bacterium]